MTKKRFWEIIEQSRRTIDPEHADGDFDNFDRQVQELTPLLSALPLDEVVSFARHFSDRLFEAYDYKLWAAAYLIGQGCSNDGFHDFRTWLISMGRQVYERALKDPDSLAEVVARPGIPDFFFEGIGAVAYEVYEARTGRKIPDYEVHHPRKPTGTRFDEDDMAYFQRTFPGLWAIYGPDFTRSASPD